MKDLMGNDDVILNLPPRDKSQLLLINYVVDKRLQAIHKNLRDNLIDESVKADGSVLVDQFRVPHRRD